MIFLKWSLFVAWPVWAGLIIGGVVYAFASPASAIITFAAIASIVELLWWVLVLRKVRVQ